MPMEPSKKLMIIRLKFRIKIKKTLRRMLKTVLIVRKTKRLVTTLRALLMNLVASRSVLMNT